MGVQISEIIPRKEISIKDLKGKVVAKRKGFSEKE